MLQHSLLAVSFLCAAASFSQEKAYDPLSLELQLGLNNPVNPMAAGYDAGPLGPVHTGIGVRYMLNPKFGLRLQGGYDHFRNGGDSPDFDTDYYRISVEGIVNAANTFHFYEETKHIGLLVHCGVGYSVMSGTQSPGTDQMLHALIGITPQVKVSERWALSLDVTSLAHVYQTRTYDFTQYYSKRGVDGYLFNLSVGVQYSFGSKTPADWVVPRGISGELFELDRKLEDLAAQQKDDDGDGVPNYLDAEPATRAGAIVDTKGREQSPDLKDSDSDGVADDTDPCPFAKGTPASGGCPDADNDGIADRSDECPLLAGTVSANGCPDIAPETASALMHAATVLQLGAKTGIPETAKPALDEVARIFQAHPEYKLRIAAHSGTAGNDRDNLALTQRQANAVRQYLVAKGIELSRITALGFGETQSVADGNGTHIGLEIRF